MEGSAGEVVVIPNLSEGARIMGGMNELRKSKGLHITAEVVILGDVVFPPLLCGFTP